MDKMSQERSNRSRERNDRISALMGQYMLRGYRMLGSVCEVCGTVLLKNLDQEDYCVACKEVDVVLDTQPPAATQDSGNPRLETDTVSQSHQNNEAAAGKHSSLSQDAINTAVQAVNEKILWASCELKASHSTGECHQLCQLLKTCAETLKALKEVE
ncbi:PREDICTED: Sjoegren syndrome/scleroderma autoantigen 1 homolog [Acropora digitifera]|uniref:Sjoegren syndrome/scleroderma autoantigen 1 homolog n=1 Tax=Acropora digitifera TaxID=70779 RepID=UPI00077AB026|nr:PREDICTED: Sjoegren syndrome/scleroderma autoantigen 1 homolog [Acropora digitifera]